MDYVPPAVAIICTVWFVVVAVGALRAPAASGSILSRLPPSAAWPFAIWASFIFLWYLQYKFTGHPGSVDLFTTLTDWLGFHGYEKVMRIGVGSCELLCSGFLLSKIGQGLGGIGAMVLMSGALFFHLASPLGIDPYGDGGILFKEACSVWLSGLATALLRRDQLFALAASLGLYRRPMSAMGA